MRVCGHTLPLVAIHHLDRSCMIVGIFLNYRVPQQWYLSQVYAYMLYARVEHKELWAIIIILLTSMLYFDSTVLLDEAAQTNITRTLTRDWLYRRALHIDGW